MKPGNANVSLKVLEQDRFIAINTNKKFKDYLKNKIASKRFTLYSLKKDLRIDLCGFLRANQRLVLKDLLFIARYLKISQEYTSSAINWIGTKNGHGISNPKIPFKFSTPEGFRFVAAILGDGSLSKTLIASYNNQSPKMINTIKETALKTFGKIEKIHQKMNEEAVITLTFPKIIGRIVHLLGLQPGRKTLVNPHIPSFILEGSKKNKIEFLKQVSDDEGSPQINIPYSYSVRFEFSVQEKKTVKPPVSNLTLDIHKLVNSLGYNTSRVYNAGVYECEGENKGINNGYQWAFDIQGKDHITRFSKEIGFAIDYKQKKLLRGIKAQKRNQLGTKKMYDTALENFKKIYKEKGFVTKHTLAKESKISLRNSIEWLMKLHRKGLIIVKKQNQFIHTGDGVEGLRGRTPNEYILL